MKISQETIKILRNFAGVNSNLLIKEGSEISTINAARNVFITATLPDSFEQDFGVYDLNEFLGVLNLFEEPSVDFTEKFAKISNGSSSVKFFAADPSVLVLPLTMNASKFPSDSSNITFDLTSAQLGTILKTAAVLRSPDVCVNGDGKTMSIAVCDLKNNTANSYSIAIGETDRTFSAQFKVENLKLMPLDYSVSISTKKMSRFVSSDKSMLVLIGNESSSYFE